MTALGIVDALALDDYRYFHSTRAELLRRLSRTDQARAAARAPSSSGPPGPSRASSSAGSPSLTGCPPERRVFVVEEQDRSRRKQ
jgi:hypothetical protein